MGGGYCSIVRTTTIVQYASLSYYIFLFGSVCYRNASLRVVVVAAGADVLLVACSLALIPHFIFGRGKKSPIVFAFCVHVACPGTCRTEYSFLLCWRALCCAIYAS